MATTYLKRTAVTSTENYKYTFSAWVKRTGVLGASSVNEVLFSNWTDSSNSAYIRFEDINDNLQVYDQYGAGPDLNYQTNMKFRDCNSWYHIVVNVDSTRSVNERCKIYVNGSQVSCSSTTDTGGTLAMKTVTTANNMIVGAIARTPSPTHEYFFSGLMSHVYYIDGTGYDASYFGETDATTGEWKIKTSVSVTYGNNGFLILKDGNTITDQSTNSNDFTLGAGTLTNTEDCPSDVFAYLNSLVSRRGTGLLNGNTTHVSSGQANPNNIISTLGMSLGKYYFEAKIGENGADLNGFGIVDENNEYINTGTNGLSSSNNALMYISSDVYRGGSTVSGTWGTASTNDLVQVALDLDNGYVYFGINDTWQNSGDPTSGATGTGGIQLSSYFSSNTTYFFAGQQGGSSSTRTMDFNFGNGYFATTAISSEGTNASNIGKFEYDVPTGYTALSTKGLNE